MAVQELVDGAGWLSDESSFYGDEETVAKLEKKAMRQLALPCEKAASPVAKNEVSTSPQPPHHEKSSHAAQTKSKLNSPHKPDADNVLGFLKSRPQIAKMQEDVDMPDYQPSPTRSVERAIGCGSSSGAVDTRFKGVEAARQQSESISEFLKRLPVADPSTANVGPWLWVSNPYADRESTQRQTEDTESFGQRSAALISTFERQKGKVERENAGGYAGTVTRKMRPYREQLEEDLLSAAITTKTTCGKWMLFPLADDLPRYWRVVAEATSEGKLGPTSKVATPEPSNGKDETLICVYTVDFSDMDDVGRVLDQLVELGLCRKDARPIYYKCDAYTYLDIMSGNPYGIKASLFSSAEFLRPGHKATQEGAVARLLKNRRGH